MANSGADILYPSYARASRNLTAIAVLFRPQPLELFAQAPEHAALGDIDRPGPEPERLRHLRRRPLLDHLLPAGLPGLRLELRLHQCQGALRQVGSVFAVLRLLRLVGGRRLLKRIEQIEPVL